MMSIKVNWRNMDDIAQDYFQLEMGRAILDMQNAQAALMRALNAATVNDKEVRRAWSLVLGNNRSAIWLASTICVAESVGYMPSISLESIQTGGVGKSTQ